MTGNRKSTRGSIGSAAARWSLILRRPLRSLNIQGIVLWGGMTASLERLSRQLAAIMGYSMVVSGSGDRCQMFFRDELVYSLQMREYGLKRVLTIDCVLRQKINAVEHCFLYPLVMGAIVDLANMQMGIELTKKGDLRLVKRVQLPLALRDRRLTHLLKALYELIHRARDLRVAVNDELVNLSAYKLN